MMVLIIMINFNTGVAFAFLRLHQQKSSLVSDDIPEALWDLEAAARNRTDATFHALDLSNGRSSPIDSPSLGAALLRILVGACDEKDVKLLLASSQFALQQSRTREFRGHQMGVDEVLQGRTGLLWSIIQIRNAVNHETQTALEPLFETVPQLMNVILDAGRRGAQQYVERYGNEDALPLMWSWIDQFCSLGAAHGITGILSVLLNPELPDVDDGILSAYPDIAETITGLCKLCIRSHGDLPMSIPPYPSTRSSPLVQVCHGTPGLLLLLAAAKMNSYFKQYWSPIWDEAIQAGTAVVWDRGLLTKGGGLCHGISGNALALLMLYDPLDESTDAFLSKGLAMLLEAQHTLPFSSSGTNGEGENANKTYQLPDHPYSLLNGLAGTVCAWSQACVLVQTKIRLFSPTS
jgi:hypothetical protein